MDLIQIFTLALLQGITEFLPISSSAHLILVPRLLGWSDQGLAFDVAVHVGTLVAVVAYLRSELVRLTLDWLGSLRQRREVGESRLAWGILLATVPVGLAGLLLSDVVETTLRSPVVIAWATVGFGVLLGWADSQGRGARPEQALGWGEMFFIGLAQALALIPGTSRSGITMTAGLALGLSRPAAARFSFLLAIPVIVLAGGLEVTELVRSPAAVDWSALLLGALVSSLSAFAAIHTLLKWLQHAGMMPFVVYRLALGAWLLYLFW